MAMIKTGDTIEISHIYTPELEELKCGKCGKTINTIKLGENIETECDCEDGDEDE